MKITVQRLVLGFLCFGVLCCTEAARPNARKSRSLMNFLRSMRSKRQDDGVWKLTDAIPGEPDRDYPILSEIPETDFSCNGRHHGYYADIGARCQVFRICANTAGDTSKGFAFLCPNGTLFNQQFFVCDWYRNVDCENSERFFNLNDQLGNTMGGASKNDMMDSAREIIMFPQQTPAYNPENNDIYSNYPTDLGSPLGINDRPSQSNSGFGQPSSSIDNFPGFPSSNGPSSGSGQPPRGFGGSDKPFRRPNGGANGGNGGTVFINNLGQLSTDEDSINFDPKASYFLKPEKDSFDSIKGIENSYSFGFADGSNSPIRGSADLSEPVDSSAFPTGDEYLPPHLNGLNQKQLFTYPHDDISPEFTGQINTELAAKSPKFEAPGIYGPAVSHQSNPSNRHQQPSQSVNSNRYQQANTPSRGSSPQSLYQEPRAPSQQNSFQQPAAPSALYAQPSVPSGLYQQPQQAPSQTYQPQQPAQNSYQQGFNQNQFPPSSAYQKPSAPSGLYQQPQYPQQNHQQSRNQYNQQPFQSPQPFRPQNQQSERRQFDVPQNNQNNFRASNDQSNEEYVRNILKDKTHIHEDKQQLTELIQRFFVPKASQERVVNTQVIPSPAKESYSFTFDNDGSPSNRNANYQSPNSANHQHGGNCGHQGYIY